MQCIGKHRVQKLLMPSTVKYRNDQLLLGAQLEHFQWLPNYWCHLFPDTSHSARYLGTGEAEKVTSLHIDPGSDCDERCCLDDLLIIHAG